MSASSNRVLLLDSGYQHQHQHRHTHRLGDARRFVAGSQVEMSVVLFHRPARYCRVGGPGCDPPPVGTHCVALKATPASVLEFAGTSA